MPLTLREIARLARVRRADKATVETDLRRRLARALRVRPVES